MRLSESSLVSSLCRASLPFFTGQFFHVIEPARPLLWNWHHDVMSDILQSARPGDRLIFNIPPGTMKSVLLSVKYNSWLWAQDPEKVEFGGPGTRVLTFSYSDENTIRDNLRVRDIVTSPEYQKLFPCRLSTSSSKKERFDTVQKGWRIASSIGGKGTGEHPHVIIIDDPSKALDALSKVKLQNVKDWYSSTVSTRKGNNPIIIVVMQRLAEDDLSDHLLKQGGFEHVCFPMRFEAGPRDEHDPRTVPDPRDIRTIPGQLLWPEQWDEKKVAETELELGPLLAPGQLQQYPVAIGGGLFKADYFQIVDSVPRDLDYCRSWDTGETDVNENPDANYTAGTKIGIQRSTGNVYIVDCIADRLKPGARDKLIKATAKLDGYGVIIREGAGAGKSTLHSHSVLLQGYDFDDMPESEPKIIRAGPFRSQCEQGNVFLLRGPWNQAFVAEFVGFPMAKYDDRVDSAANGYLALVRPEKRAGGGWEEEGESKTVGAEEPEEDEREDF